MAHANPEYLEIDSFSEHALDGGDAPVEFGGAGRHECHSYGRPLPFIVMVDLGNREGHPVTQVGDYRLQHPSFGFERTRFWNTEFDPQGGGVHRGQVRATSRTS